MGYQGHARSKDPNAPRANAFPILVADRMEAMKWKN